MKRQLKSKSLKATLIMLLSVLVMSCGMLSRNANDIIDDMRDAREAQYVNVGSGLLGLGRLVLPTLSQSNIGITSVRVLDMSRCDRNVREKFRNRIQGLYKNRSYDEIVTNQSRNDNLSVLVRRDGQYVSEVVLANASATTDALVVITGHINLEDVERIINDQKTYFIQ